MGKLSVGFASRAEAVARHLLGEPTIKTATQLRWGRKGSLVVHVAGERMGHFYDYQEEQGGDLVDLVQRELRLPPGAALHWLRQVTRINSVSPAATFPLHVREMKGLRWSRKAQFLWKLSQPLAGTLGETYLNRRNCDVADVCDLRFLPDSGKYPPALVAKVTDFCTGQAMALSFIRLDPYTATKLGSAYLTGHAKKGGVVRLVPCIAVGGALGLAEGIDTALSVIKAGRGPVWAALGAGNLAKLPPLRAFGELRIWGDHDEAGLRACEGRAARWTAAGHVVRVLLPPTPGQDWNDVVRGEK